MLDLYVAPLYSGEMSDELIPRERHLEVISVASERVRREKYSVWKLLAHALKASLGMSVEDAALRKDENGKWHSPHCCLSLTHGAGTVAVALSDSPVGVDAEGDVTPRSSSFATRIMTEREHARYLSLDESERTAFLTECWTRKESIFKMRDDAHFIPSECDTSDSETVTKRISLGGTLVTVSVASDRCDELTVYVLEKI